MNAELEPPGIYNSRDFVPEQHRQAFTRMRLGSHRLKVETGRWSRIPKERRLCMCGIVQDEIQVLLNCPLLDNVRGNFREMNFSSLNSIASCENFSMLAKYMYEVLKKTNEMNKTD